MPNKIAFVGSVASLLLLIAHTASASTRLTVCPIVPVRGQVPDDTTAEMTTALREEISRLQGVEVLGKCFVARTKRQRKREQKRRQAQAAALQAALQQIEEGRTHLERLRLRAATRALRRGIRELEIHLARLPNHDKLVEARLLLATAYFRKGRANRALEVLEEVVILRPAMQLSAGTYPPLFFRTFEDARRRVLAAPRGGLRVETEDPGAEVFLNGRPFGTTPVIIESVVAGPNHLVVRQLGAATSTIVDVPIGRTTEITPDLGGVATRRRLYETIARNRFNPDVASRARTLSRRAGADHVLLTAMGKVAKRYVLTGILGNVSTGTWTRLTPVAPDLDLIAASIDARALAVDLQAQLTAPKSPVEGRVAFIPEVEPAAVAAATAARHRVSFAASDLVLPESKSPSRRPVVMASAAQQATDASSGLLSDPSNKILSRATAGPGKAPQRPQPVSLPLGASHDGRFNRAVAAVDTTGATNSELGSDGQPVITVTDTTVFGAWWFWTAVGVGVSMLAGGGWLYHAYLQEAGATDTLVIEAEWR